MSLNKLVITDTSCFVLFYKIDGFVILHKLFGSVFTTPEIASEYGEQLPEWVVIQPVKNQNLLTEYQQKVDPGEASALALAKEINADLVILDDLEARKFALNSECPSKGHLAC